MVKNKAINDKIAMLEKKYSKDPDALDEIKRAKETILYYEKQGNEEKVQAEAKQLEAFLHDWF